jgi:hypothetical protein
MEKLVSTWKKKEYRDPWFGHDASILRRQCKCHYSEFSGFSLLCWITTLDRLTVQLNYIPKAPDSIISEIQIKFKSPGSATIFFSVGDVDSVDPPSRWQVREESCWAPRTHAVFSLASTSRTPTWGTGVKARDQTAHAPWRHQHQGTNTSLSPSGPAHGCLSDCT